jgi:hypothetical protein
MFRIFKTLFRKKSSLAIFHKSTMSKSKAKDLASPSIFSSHGTFNSSPRSAVHKINLNTSRKNTGRSKKPTQQAENQRNMKLIKELDLKQNDLKNLFSRIKKEKQKLTVKKIPKPTHNIIDRSFLNTTSQILQPEPIDSKTHHPPQKIQAAHPSPLIQDQRHPINKIPIKDPNQKF